MPVSSAAALAGFSNQSRGASLLGADPRWNPMELWAYEGKGLAIRRAERCSAPRDASFTGVIFDHPSSLGWLGGQIADARRAKSLANLQRGRADMFSVSSGSVV